ncbi:autotransporter outer membrane beta-barrel domain-containing protein [Stenotrophomonas rhizophila]|uniref:autotransporter outer membrane beta-barrel domain-containing protein n=1 Tax=Stenotrophomonas TaxID=40323 RepID=UPI00131775AB|nr:autotransporter domain-containing protein [Stenotrophomonas sp. 364]QHB72524.1 autotransporter domain-containing protein [Stenotrophomonas sp. 364]
MLLSKRPLRSLMAVAIALAAAPAMAQSPYTKTVVFGDSLSDAGYFRPLLPASANPIIGQFTTNPGWIWAEYVADYYGTNGGAHGNGQNGDNYAIGGARVGVDTSQVLVPGTPAVPVYSLKTQMNQYLAANGGKADPNALYTVWGGANDLFAIQRGAPLAATLGAAVTDQVGIVGTLKAAGAQYVVVPTIPDIGLTPDARAAGPAGMAAGTALAKAYNDALFGGLKAAGLQVIPVDTFHILQEIVASPSTYGFVNATGKACLTATSLTCSPAAYATPDAYQTYVFADGVHPSNATHQMLGQYTLSILEAPRNQQILTHSAQTVGRSRADQVSWHLDGRPADGLSWWGNLRGDMQRYAHADLYDGMAPAGLFGVDWARDGMVVGGFAGYGRMDADFGNSKGDFTQSDTSLGLFAGWYGERVWVNGQVSYSWLDYDVTRKVQLGPATRIHEGSPEGSNLTAALNAGYEFGTEGGFRHGPVAAVIWQKVKLDGYTESNPSATALGYGNQDVDSTVGRIGWQARFDGGSVKPYVQVTYDHEFEDDKQASAWLQSMPEVGMYKVPGLEFDKNYATAVLGARLNLWGLNSNVGMSTTTLQKRARDVSLFASFSGSF